MIIPFAPWHVGMMGLPESRALEVSRYVGALERLGQAGWVRTLVSDDPSEGVVIIGIAGVVPLGNGEGEVFVVTSENVRVREFVTGVRRLLEVARGHFARIRALGEEGDPRIERWLSWLGFQQIGTELSRVTEGKRMVVWRLV
jgi:hypothetical protein